MPSSSAASRRPDRCGRPTTRSSTATSTSTTIRSTPRSISTARTSSPGRAACWGSRRSSSPSIQQNDAPGRAQTSWDRRCTRSRTSTRTATGRTTTASSTPTSASTDHQLQNTLGINDPAEVNGDAHHPAHQRLLPRRGPRAADARHERAQGPARRPHRQLCRSSTSASGSTATATILEFSPEFAAARARGETSRSEATKKYIHEIPDQLTPQQVALLLGKGPTLGIVIDTTNSMGPIIAAVRNRATQLVNARLGTPKSRRSTCSGRSSTRSTPAPVVTANPDDVQVGDRGADHQRRRVVDCPELAMAGMLAALGAADPGGQLFVFTDASAKDSALAGSVSALAQSKHIARHLHSLRQLLADRSGYIQIANETGGRVFFLTARGRSTRPRTLPGLARRDERRSTCSRSATRSRAARRTTPSRSTRP